MRRLAIMVLGLIPGWALAQATADAPAAQPQVPGVTSGHFLETLVGLAVVVMLIFAIAFVLRRFGGIPGTGKGQVQVLGGVSVGTRERAVLVSVAGKRLLLGVAPGSVRTLYELPGEASDADFEQQLDKAKGEGRS